MVVKMEIRNVTLYGVGCIEVTDARLVNHPYSDVWYIFRRCNSVVAHIGTYDGNDYKDIVIDQRTEPEVESYWSGLSTEKLAEAVKDELDSRLSEPDNDIHEALGRAPA